MKRGIFKTAALAACVALHASVAESPSGNGDGSNAELFSGILKHPAPSKVVAILAWGEHTMGPNIQRQTTFIRRVATEAERRIAEQRAAAYHAKLSQAQKTEIKKKKRYWAVPITKAKPPRTARPKVPGEEPKKEPKETPKEEEIMIYDPLGGSLVNKYVYTIPNMPPSDTAMSVDGYEPLLFVGR
jgi:hypothetical protein